MKTIWSKTVHASACVVMLSNQVAAQTIRIPDGNDVTEGAKADAACSGPGSSCSAIALGKANFSVGQAILTAVLGSVPAGTAFIGYLGLGDGTNTSVLDPCQSVTKTFTPINVATVTTVLLAAGVSGKKISVCSFHVVGAAADNVALIEGTGGTCAGGSVAGLAGSTTAGSGWNFSANGGISLGNGGFSVLQTANATNSVCVAVSATTQLSGNIGWVAR